MKFKFEADTEFEADDLDDALRILIKHFLSILAGSDEDMLDHVGRFSLGKVDDEK